MPPASVTSLPTLGESSQALPVTAAQAQRRRPIVLRHASDERLAELARDGDERAFEALVERYGPRLRAHARRIAGEHLSQDVIQHAFASAWHSLRRGREVRHVRAWLFAIVHNSALQAIADRHATAGELTPADARVQSVAEEFEGSLRARAALSAVAALPLREREALVAMCIDGRSTRDLGRELGLGDNAVRQLVFRARARARAALAAFSPPAIALRVRGRVGDVHRTLTLFAGTARRAHALIHPSDTLGALPSPAAIASALVLVVAGAEAGNLALAHGSRRPAHAHGATQALSRRDGASTAGISRRSTARAVGPARNRAARAQRAETTALAPRAPGAADDPASVDATGAPRGGSFPNPATAAGAAGTLPVLQPPVAPSLPAQAQPGPGAVGSVGGAVGPAVGGATGLAGELTSGSGVQHAAEHVVANVTAPVAAPVGGALQGVVGNRP